MFLCESEEVRTLVELASYFAIDEGDEGLSFHACKWKRHVWFGLIGDEYRSIEILRRASLGEPLTDVGVFTGRRITDGGV